MSDTVARAPRVAVMVAVLAAVVLLAGCARPEAAAQTLAEASTPAPTPTKPLQPTFTPTPGGDPTATPTEMPSPTAAVAITATAVFTETAAPPDDTPVPEATLTPTPTETPAVTVAASEPVLTPAAQLIYGGPPVRKWIALSLDVEGWAEPLTPILDTLQQEGVRATFFIQGQFAERYPDLIRRIVADGHVVGNHSWSHPDFRTLTREQMIEELQKTDDKIVELTGQTTKPLFRPPYSYRNDASIQVAGDAGYLSIVWTTETYDWRQGATAQTMVESVLKEARSGGIVVMHTSHNIDATGLPLIIAALRAEGYAFATIPEVLSPPQ